MAQLHRPLTEQIVVTDIRSAEMINMRPMLFCRQKSIGRVFQHLRAADVGHDDLLRQRLMQPDDRLSGALRIRADHDPVGMKRILDGRTLPEKFRQRDTVEPFDSPAADQILTRSFVPTGTVLFTAMILYPFIACAISTAAWSI